MAVRQHRPIERHVRRGRLKVAKWLDEEEEQKRLNDFCIGKTVRRIDYDGHFENLVIQFSDESVVTISTLGGLEIEDLAEGVAP